MTMAQDDPRWDDLVWHFACPHCGYKRLQGEGPASCGYKANGDPLCHDTYTVTFKDGDKWEVDTTTGESFQCSC